MCGLHIRLDIIFYSKCENAVMKLSNGFAHAKVVNFIFVLALIATKSKCDCTMLN